MVTAKTGNGGEERIWKIILLFLTALAVITAALTGAIYDRVMVVLDRHDMTLVELKACAESSKAIIKGLNETDNRVYDEIRNIKEEVKEIRAERRKP